MASRANSSETPPLCDICCTSQSFRTCCGVSACPLCHKRLHRLCSVCQRDGMLEEWSCHTCESSVSLRELYECYGCEKLFCKACLSMQGGSMYVCVTPSCEQTYMNDMQEEYESYYTDKFTPCVWKSYLKSQ